VRFSRDNSSEHTYCVIFAGTTSNISFFSKTVQSSISPLMKPLKFSQHKEDIINHCVTSTCRHPSARKGCCVDPYASEHRLSGTGRRLARTGRGLAPHPRHVRRSFVRSNHVSPSFDLWFGPNRPMSQIE